MDLALNNLQRLICHKTQPTNLNSLKYCSNMHFVLVLVFTLSKYAIIYSIPANIVSIICWNRLGTTFNPKGSLRIPLCVFIVSYFEHFSLILT